MTRTIALVRSETDLLTRGLPVDWRDFAERKSRLLLELSRTQRTLAGEPDANLLNLARKLRDELRKNSEVVGRQVQASRQIVGILADAVSDCTSDGTYSMPGRER
jgi:hypothetical protein